MQLPDGGVMISYVR